MSEGYPSVSGPKWQWTADLALIGKRIMTLNTDMEVFFDLQLDQDGKAGCRLEVDCDVKQTCGTNGVCALSPSYPYAILYAKVCGIQINTLLLFEYPLHAVWFVVG